MQFKKKPVVIEATQWFKDGDHPAVQIRPVEVVFSADKGYFYISHADDVQSKTSPFKMVSAWLAVDPNGELAAKNGAVLPFAFWKVQSGPHEPIADHPELLQRYMEMEGWTRPPRDMGVIDTLEGRHIVTPGDWIITGVKGEHYACKPDIFAETYEEA